MEHKRLYCTSGAQSTVSRAHWSSVITPQAVQTFRSLRKICAASHEGPHHSPQECEVHWPSLRSKSECTTKLYCSAEVQELIRMTTREWIHGLVLVLATVMEPCQPSSWTYVCTESPLQYGAGMGYPVRYLVHYERTLARKESFVQWLCRCTAGALQVLPRSSQSGLLWLGRLIAGNRMYSVSSTHTPCEGCKLEA